MEREYPRYPKRSDEILKELVKAEKAGKLEKKVADIFLNYEIDMAAIWKCRDYIRKLPDEFYIKYPPFITCRILIETMCGDYEKTQELISKLGRTPKELDPEKFTIPDLFRVMMELILPSLNDAEFVRRAKFLSSYMPGPARSLALNACRPSIINGFRDMTELCPIMEKKKATIERMCKNLYGRSSKGIYEVCLAEWVYETGNAFEALILVAGTIPSLIGAEDVRCLFVAFLLQMRILILNGQAKTNEELFARIENIIKEENYEELEASLYSMICLQSCYENNRKYVENWMKKQSPDEDEELFMMNPFPYFVKVRGYLQTGNYKAALNLAQRIYVMCEPAHRPHDKCECLILSAMACYKLDDMERALENFEQAVKIGKKHGYVRLFADEGRMMLDLLRLYKRKHPKVSADDEWLEKVHSIALETASRFPEYLD